MVAFIAQILFRTEKKFTHTKKYARMLMRQGCHHKFTTKQLYRHNSLYKIDFNCMTHTNIVGSPCHGFFLQELSLSHLDAYDHHDLAF